ncbi:cellulose binding domain-containing protein [Streptomyces sp. NPDC006967]|uniref:cellulose binding domain-containing protein n=1 Tax=unclassified Streptomyces TaxID=2593676 RepID=UPI000CD55428|nr:cellulose binding domain-containing protein [Streptomyces sp. SM1]
MSRLWHASLSRSGPAVTVRNTDWNGAVAPGSCATFAFTATRSAANTAPPAFELGDRARTVRREPLVEHETSTPPATPGSRTCPAGSRRGREHRRGSRWSRR